MNITEGKPDRQQTPKMKHTLNIIHFTKTRDHKCAVDTLFWKNPKQANHGDSGQINQDVKYSQATGQRHQSENPCQMKNSGRKTIRTNYHCKQ